MARLVFLGLFLVLALHPVSAFADAPSDREDPRALLEGATRQILRALELIMGAIPQYELPKVLENGDIIIRRVRPDGRTPSPPPTDGDIEETST